ncbi:nitrite reductase small subunit NirD [Saccharospirillum sp. HFRX-1]|uniref:nitrite reductase small subunit NirD n=1 Tax=unclassified Saccharospirillum TaxID=2633430 RepID=UPI00371EDC04
MTAQSKTLNWQAVCQRDDLVPESGVAVRLQGRQIALFYLPDQGAVYALDNHDPFSSANVLARGIVGDIGGDWAVAGPLYKQHFRLEDGQCIEDAAVRISTWPARLVDDRVEIALS